MVAVKMIREGAIDYVSKDSDHFLDSVEKATIKALKVAKLSTDYNSQRSRKKRFLQRTVFILFGVAVSLILIWILNLNFG